MNENTIEIIKATAPVIKEHGEKITTAMYNILFTKHPEAKILFKNAAPDQHKKLAAMVYAYAANIDNLGVLGKGVEKVANIHVNVDVKPEHYPWVGEALLGAIEEVLGEAATPEIMNAWKEAFFFLADVFINKEQEIYAKQASATADV
jgi:nitric oxide dioxygenase